MTSRSGHTPLRLKTQFHRFKPSRWTAASALLLAFAATFASAQDLQVTFGSKGIQTLSYKGVLLEDVSQYPADSFHIWHMKATDLQGNLLTRADCGWGEANSGEIWDPATHTETYVFSWGSIATQFVQSGDKLDLLVSETNNPGSGVIFDGAEIFPLALHFPRDPAGFSGYTQYAITTTGPGVSAADFGSGVVTSVIPDESVPLYGGWKAAGANTYTPIMTSTAPDGLATFLPHIDRPVLPGTSFTYTVSLRFTPEGAAPEAADAYASFAATYPSQMTWSDKRILGTAYLASSPVGNGDITQPGGFPTNPRRYFNDAAVDITTPAGLRDFQSRMLNAAAGNVANAQAMNAQGVITWDIEGEQFPQDTSYVCSPDQIATVAPEMESTITDTSSPFFGMKLDDAYFKTMSNAGLKIGLCLRPQAFTLAANGTSSQVFLEGNNAIIANLENKARYANARWGATIFYVDSTVDVNGGTLDPAIFQQLISDLPSFLFIPEESTPRYYAYTAPFYSFIFHTDLGTPASIYNIYPNAFGANLVNDVSADKLATYTPQLTNSVAHGDILMGHADYWQANDPVLVAIYKDAGVSASPAPVQVAPAIMWSAPAPVSFGTSALRPATKRDREHARQLRLHPRSGHGAARRNHNAAGHLYARRYEKLYGGDRIGKPHCKTCNPRHHVEHAAAHHLRHAPGRCPIECRGEYTRHLHLHTARGPKALHRHADSAGHLYTSRHGKLHRGHRDHNVIRRRRSSPHPVPDRPATRGRSAIHCRCDIGLSRCIHLLRRQRACPDRRFGSYSDRRRPGSSPGHAGGQRQLRFRNSRRKLYGWTGAAVEAIKPQFRSPRQPASGTPLSHRPAGATQDPVAAHSPVWLLLKSDRLCTSGQRVRPNHSHGSAPSPLRCAASHRAVPAARARCDGLLSRSG